ncbi:hypothetical protein [Tsuneonella mangrovi]|uniref:hypothetical protein n=1 Tax=Tsuneonella mangrovi TaxID=1982042 RepID=UPI000BA299ED|nr:hypothetical protein [Tsuneonella mangrovi]
MPELLNEPLPPERNLALAYMDGQLRPAASAAFALDARLAALVAQASEPLLAQMRLAWWRDQLRLKPSERALGEPLLAAFGQHWTGQEGVLLAMVDAWEELLGDAPLPKSAIARFAEGRAQAFAALARLAAMDRWAADCVRAAQRWTLADFALHTGNGEERDLARALATEFDRPKRLPRQLRGLAILESLATRSLANGRPLMEGRSGAMLALRVGLFGR